MKIADYEKVKLPIDNRKGLELVLRRVGIVPKQPNTSEEIVLRSFNGASKKVSVRASTLKTFLQGELKEVDKQLKALGVVL